MRVQVGKIYKHFKNGECYRVIGIGKHSETLEVLVVYECLYNNGVSNIWIRPIDNFTSQIEYDGQVVDRFQLQEKLSEKVQRYIESAEDRISNQGQR